MKETGYFQSAEFTVRDYECDIQGVVNNANYLHYLEHARHEFLISRGIDFIQLHHEGLDLIVTRSEIEYKYPLRSRDKFVVNTNIRREGNIRLVFLQDILQDRRYEGYCACQDYRSSNNERKTGLPGRCYQKTGFGLN